MTTYFKIEKEGKKIAVELLDKMAFFEEGETIIIEEDSVRKHYKIYSINKVIKVINDKADCVFEILLMAA